MKQLLFSLVIACVLLVGGCTKESPNAPRANVPPKTFLWLFPDSTLAEGQSRQHIRWWGEDPDGVVKGFLVVGAKFVGGISQGSILDTIGWRWKIGNDSIVPFPLLTKRDTFDVEVRAVDNTFASNLPDQALIRFAPVTGAASAPFWDVNENGVYDAGDVLLTTLRPAMDPNGAKLGMPLLNQPPSIVFAQNPNNPTVQMQQPETTFTAATFSWIGSDPDGDQTIASYELALNDTSTPGNIVSIPGNITIVSLLVPRARTDSLSGVQAVAADLWSGTFLTTRRSLGTIPNLRLDTLNSFYVRARDIAGDASPYIRMGDPTHRWFVKRPKGKMLIISDYILFDRVKALNYYKGVFGQIGFSNIDVLDIALGLTPTDKSLSKFGRFVPPFLDPALIYTLQLFDLVYWFTDTYPSLAAAQLPLYQYVRDQTHRGKVIFSTMFATATDPRGALTDFAPIDSVSSVFLSNAGGLPTMGETKMPVGYNVIPDSSDPGDIFPPLVFGNPALTVPGQAIFSLYMRPIYRRADAKYIYHMQADTRTPISYTYLATLNDLKAAAIAGTSTLMCGAGGTILRSSDAGTSWKVVTSGSQSVLESMAMLDAQNGIIVGDGGTILRTSDAGITWVNQSVITEENLLTIATAGPSLFVVGTDGLLIRSSNSGTSWSAININTTATLRGVAFSDASTGLVTGDGGLVAKTSDGGSTWRSILSLTSAALFGVTYASPSTVVAYGNNTTIIRSTNAGESWSQASTPNAPNTTIRSVVFLDAQNGFAVGADNAVPPAAKIWRTGDGGQTWVATQEQFGPIATQTFNSIVAADPQNLWIAASTGNILHSTDGGTTWAFQPQGNINVAVLDGPGIDGKSSFLFLGLPLHYLDGAGGPSGTVIPFLQHVIQQEFGF